jgi:Zn-dependent alcohol dehydrogenase
VVAYAIKDCDARQNHHAGKDIAVPLIKAAVCHEFGTPLVIEDVDLRAPQGSEVEVTVDAVAICHSDISFASGGWGGSLPAVYGHEAAGRITAVGDQVRGLALAYVSSRWPHHLRPCRQPSRAP